MKTETIIEQKVGGFKRIDLPSGGRAIVFPESGLSAHVLDPDSWETMTSMGNVRAVYSIDRLKDGLRPGIIVKSPERIFTKESKYLEEGNPWWGGPRTVERKVIIKNNPIVESQSLWEGIILFELNRLGFRAEIPVALIETKTGSNLLVVKEIPINHGGGRGEGAPKLEELLRYGFVPAGDWQGHNLLRDAEGNEWIIDVNRWQWRPHTDSFTRELIDLVRSTSER